MLHHRAVGGSRWTFGTEDGGRASARRVGRYRLARGSAIHDFRGLEPPEPLLATLARPDQHPELHQRGRPRRVARDPRGIVVRMWPGRPGAPS